MDMVRAEDLCGDGVKKSGRLRIPLRFCIAATYLCVKEKTHAPRVGRSSMVTGWEIVTPANPSVVANAPNQNPGRGLVCGPQRCVRGL
jgi:hypothetical protein